MKKNKITGGNWLSGARSTHYLTISTIRNEIDYLIKLLKKLKKEKSFSCIPYVFSREQVSNVTTRIENLQEQLLGAPDHSDREPKEQEQMQVVLSLFEAELLCKSTMHNLLEIPAHFPFHQVLLGNQKRWKKQLPEQLWNMFEIEYAYLATTPISVPTKKIKTIK